MTITHNRKMQAPDWELWIDKGLALDGISSVTLSYQFTQSDLQRESFLLKGKTPEEQEQIRNEQVLARNAKMKALMDEIPFRFPCYQYEENDELAYEGQDWDFFFWCRDLTPPLSGRDYSYITLNANERQTPQRQEQAFAELLEFLVELCGDNQNLYVDVLHQLRYNQERFQSAVDQAKRVLPGCLCTYRGLKGSLELTVNGRLLFIPRQKRKAPAKISDTDMIRQLWIIEDGKAGEYLCLD